MNKLYSNVLDKIASDLENGVAPWEKPWKGDKGAALLIPHNAATGKPYRGINIFLLWIRAAELGVNDLRFLTYKQATDLGGNVKKGEKSCVVMFFKPLAITDKDTGEDKTIPLLKSFNVFHISQCENLSLNYAAHDPETMPSDCAEFIAASGARVLHGGNVAAYVPSMDTITMPNPDTFVDLDTYRETLYHEMIHWTGAKSRCNRKKDSYAFEELVAEMGAAFLCAEFGLPYTTRHAEYLGHWAKMIRDKNASLYQAASQAQKACDWIRDSIAGKEMAA